ncbi:hypothetical protein ACTWQL_16290 [Pseudalkalibacillus sp. R45]
MFKNLMKKVTIMLFFVGCAVGQLEEIEKIDTSLVEEIIIFADEELPSEH